MFPWRLHFPRCEGNVHYQPSSLLCGDLVTGKMRGSKTLTTLPLNTARDTLHQLLQWQTLEGRLPPWQHWWHKARQLAAPPPESLLNTTINRTWDAAPQHFGPLSPGAIGCLTVLKTDRKLSPFPPYHFLPYGRVEASLGRRPRRPYHRPNYRFLSHLWVTERLWCLASRTRTGSEELHSEGSL